MSHWRVEISDTCALIARFPTCEAAEAHIEALAAAGDRDRVEAGFYGITGPCPDPGETITNEGGEPVTGAPTMSDKPALYAIFVRNWYRRVPGRGIVPGAGRKARKGHPQRVTLDEARAYCATYNANHAPGPLSRKAEFEAR